MKPKTIVVLVIFSLLMLIISNSAIGQETSPVDKLEQSTQEVIPKETNMIEVNVDKDLMTFVKTAFWIAGVFLAIVSFIGIAFFGFDVRNARKHLSETKKELDEKSDLLKELFNDVKNEKQTLEKNRIDFENYVKQAQEKVEQLGAEIEGLINLKDETIAGEVAETTELTPNTNIRDNINLLRDIISNSSFEWTSLKRIISKTGLNRDEILKIARKDPGIVISISSKSKDHIFKLKQ